MTSNILRHCESLAATCLVLDLRDSEPCQTSKQIIVNLLAMLHHVKVLVEMNVAACNTSNRRDCC